MIAPRDAFDNHDTLPYGALTAGESGSPSERAAGRKLRSRSAALRYCRGHEVAGDLDVARMSAVSK
jgi:hypothetical protein